MLSEKTIRIIECPRDAMQGIKTFIPSETKIKYLNALLAVGFDILDFGSFVSPQAVPQLADTHHVLQKLDWASSPTKLLAIVANLRGAQDAVKYEAISFVGYPFSISETFQLRNTRKSLDQSWEIINAIYEECVKSGKEVLVYLSMAFGNPYGDPWEEEIVFNWMEKLSAIGIRYFALADTVGTSQPEQIVNLFSQGIEQFPSLELGAHFHAHPRDRMAKITAAYEAGCRRFDVALQGYGGCPFAEDELVGNIATESLIGFCENNDIQLSLNKEAFTKAQHMVKDVFEHS